MSKKIIRITTIPLSLQLLLEDQVKFMVSNGFEVKMISAWGPEIEEIVEREGVSHHVIPFTRKISPLKDFLCLFLLVKLFIKEKPDIVHTHTPKAGLLGMLAAWITGVKIRIHTVAGLPLMTTSGIKKRILLITEMVTYYCSSQVWPNSPSLLNFINKNKLTQSHKLKMISKGSSNGIDLKKFSPENVSKSSLEEIKKNHSLTPGCTYSLFVGRLVKDKGIDILIRAFQSMKIKEHQLVLLGSFEKDHDLLPETLEAIQKNNSIIHIEWAKNVKDYMALADLLIHPSFREGFPNVLLQAGAMRTPIICSAIPGNIDIIKHKHTGLVYESLSEIELVKQLSWAFLNWDKMTEYADKLYNIVHENYGRNKIHSTILQNYNRLIYE